jgi:ATP-dependent Lon protease
LKQLFTPVFPLGIVVFPGEKINLHIFEPRYRQLLKDCRNSNSEFSINTFFNGKIYEIGTLVKILRVNEELPNGHFDIQVQGKERFQMERFYNHLDGKLYPGAEGQLMEEGNIDYASHSQELEEYLNKLLKLNFLFFKIPKNELGHISSFDIAHIVGLNLEDKYNLLKTLTESDRKKLLIEKLQGIVQTLENINEAKERIRHNGTYRYIVGKDH